MSNVTSQWSTIDSSTHAAGWNWHEHTCPAVNGRLWQILSLKCARIDVGWSCTPNSAWRLQRPQLLAGIKGLHTPWSGHPALAVDSGKEEKSRKTAWGKRIGSEMAAAARVAGGYAGKGKDSKACVIMWLYQPIQKLQKCNKRIHLQYAGTAIN